MISPLSVTGALLVAMAAGGMCTVASTTGNASASRPASVAAPKVVDRTFACTTTRVVVEGYPDSYVSEGITVGMSPPTRNHHTGAYVAGSIGVSDENAGSLVGLDNAPSGGRTSGGISVDPKLCTWRRGVRIPLSAKGLRAEPRRIAGGYDCVVPRRILVRVRAVLSRPANWKLSRGVLGVRSRRLPEAQLAIRTASGKPVAFADLQTTRGELYVSRKSPRCVAG